ncbi:acyl-CoA dehydrogenase family protein [Nocardiopsis sp. LOL_012]|uniref:acyl-CoA dehydrogenase family protein n=1 Tax=Nocardiopsis sp. LOL_012 TaxID=3345409 RepID=UPI003A85DC99
MENVVTAPSREELVRGASELVPYFRERAAWAEEHRTLPDEAVGKMTEAGFLKMRVPHRYGGYECDMRTTVEVIAEVARGDGSAGWTVSVWSICNWLTGLFPDEAQEEVFASGDTRVCGLLSPTGTAAEADGGFVVNGSWSFNTGAAQSQWNSLVAMAPTPDGGQQPIMALAPVSDLKIVDDWHTSGLRGTGSVTTVAEDLFIPGSRVLPMGPALQEHYASRLNADRPTYRAPLLLTACVTAMGSALGLAMAARDVFFERLPHRGITYTTYASQSEAPLTHLQVADAQMRIDEAWFHAHSAADLLDTKNAAGDQWTLEERARVRMHAGFACLRAKEAVDILQTASGASSIYETVPMQRISRDIATINLHAILHPNTNLELYGRLLCGLEPNTFYI